MLLHRIGFLSHLCGVRGGEVDFALTPHISKPPMRCKSDSAMNSYTA
ncbi:hypothetical protein [Moraxella oblonga]